MQKFDARATLAKRRADVAAMFDGVAGRYDLMNDAMTGGLVRAWRAETLRAVDPRPGAAAAAVTDAGGRGCRTAVDRPAEVGATLVVTVTCPVATEVPVVGALLPDVEVRTRAAMRVER